MCTPLLALASVASTGLQSAGAILSYMGQKQQAEQQSQMAENAAKSALDSNRQQQAYLTSKYMQQREQISQEENLRTIQEEQAKGRARAAAGEAGVSGVALDSVLGDLESQRNASQVAALQNLQIQQMDTYQNQQNAYAQAMNQRNSVAMGIAPSILSPILQTAGSAVDSYSSYRRSSRSG